MSQNIEYRKETMDVLLSSFCGAAFAFIFIRVTEYLNAYYDRLKRNRNCLVKIQYILNDVYEAINNNLFVAETLVEMLTKYTPQNPIFPITPNRFVKIEYDQTILSELLDTAYINELSTFFYNVNRLNMTMRDWNVLYDMQCQSVLKQVDSTGMAQVNIETIKNLKSGIDTINKFLIARENGLQSVLASNKVFTDATNLFFTQIVCWMYKRKNISNFEEKRQTALMDLKKQVAEQSKKNEEEIKKIISDGQAK